MIKYRHDFWKERGSIMSKKLKTEAVDHLFDAILCLQNREECYTFFEDVCTVNELLSLSQRFEVAGMLRDRMIVFSGTDADTHPCLFSIPVPDVSVTDG